MKTPIPCFSSRSEAVDWIISHTENVGKVTVLVREDDGKIFAHVFKPTVHCYASYRVR